MNDQYKSVPDEIIGDHTVFTISFPPRFSQSCGHRDRHRPVGRLRAFCSGNSRTPMERRKRRPSASEKDELGDPANSFDDITQLQ